jgi:hypothetical protein
MINIQAKKKKTLKELTDVHPEVLDELESVISKATAEERRMFLSNMNMLESSGGVVDRHYAIYENLATPANVQIDGRYVKGYVENGKPTKEETMNLPETLKHLYESFSGGDSVVGTTQGGTVLKKRQTEGEFRLVQLIVNSRYNTDPYCRNAIDNYTRYIRGNGIRLMLENDEVRECLENFIRQTKIDQLFGDFVKTCFKDGECGFTLLSKIKKNFFDKAKAGVAWSVHKVLSEEVRAFEVHVEDAGRKYAYLRQFVIQDVAQMSVVDKWIADVDYWYQFNSRDNLIAFDGGKAQNHAKLTEGEVLAWFQHGDKRELRGRVPLEPILRDLRLFEDFKISRAILNYERSKVLYVKQERVSLARKSSSTEVKKSASPKGGVQITIGPNEKYTMETASLNADDASTDGLLFLYSMSSGVSIPIYILGMRADQQNYSAIKNTDSPFNQMILEYASEFTSFLGKIWRWVIERNIEAGVLPEKITIKVVAKEKQKSLLRSMESVYRKILERRLKEEDLTALQDEFVASMTDKEIDTRDISIETVIADAVKPNPLENAKTVFIERKLGMVSSRTLAEKRGYNWPQELMRQLEEAALGIWSSGNSTGQSNSSTANTGDSAQGLDDNSDNSSGDGLDMGKSIDDGSGTANQPTK